MLDSATIGICISLTSSGLPCALPYMFLILQYIQDILYVFFVDVVSIVSCSSLFVVSGIESDSIDNY